MIFSTVLARLAQAKQAWQEPRGGIHCRAIRQPTYTQIVFIKGQQALDIGDIGVFELDGDAYIKKLGHSELLSLNPLYEPIKIFYDSSFHIFGNVLG